MNEIFRKLVRLQKLAFIAGTLFLAFTTIGIFTDAHAVAVSYLFSYVFWMLLALGCLLATMLHCLAGGDWGVVTRRIFEAGSMTFPVLALLFIPIGFGLHELYSWANPGMVAADPVLKQKALYDNPPAFLLRTIIFFVITIGMTLRLRRWSVLQDLNSTTEPTIKMRTLSGPGIVIIPFAATFILIDWVMSIEGDWFSTIFPLILIAGGFLAALAFVVTTLVWLQRHPPFENVIMVKHFHDLGNLLLAFVMFWTYIAFSQWLITYSGNQPHEIAWYLSRTTGGWKWLILLVVIFYFFVPFFVLLSRSAKQSGRVLKRVAVLILIMNVLAMFWTIMPTFYPAGLRIHWTDLTAWLGIGGIWAGIFCLNLRRHPLLIHQFPQPSAIEPVPVEK